MKNVNFHFNSLDIRQQDLMFSLDAKPAQICGNVISHVRRAFSSSCKIGSRAIAPVANAIVENVEFENEDEVSNLGPNQTIDF